MSENLRIYTKAIYGFDHVLKLTTPKTLARTSPCAGWTGHAVADHVLGGVRMVLGCATTGRPPSRYPKTPAEPLATWEKLRDQTLEALDHSGVLQRMAEEPFGPEFGSMPMDTFVWFMSADLAVHTWDLARAAKVDQRLDPGLVKAATKVWKSLPESMLRGQGMFAKAVKPVAGADAQTRLLNFLGRAA